MSLLQAGGRDAVMRAIGQGLQVVYNGACAGVAQLAEHRTCNAGVASSTLAPGSILAAG